MGRMSRVSLAGILGAVLAACSSSPMSTDDKQAAAAPAEARSTTPPAAAGSAGPAPASKVATVVVPPHRDPNSALSKQRSVYFDYDDFAVKEAYRVVIETQGKYLQSHPELAVRIEGNSDERGSAEYNLSLGQRRAEAVVRALQVYGVRTSQVEPVSYGEERPQAAGHDEAAWSQNRRADIAYRN